MDIATREVVTDAIRYWERARIFYNLVLAAVVIAQFVASLPGSMERLTLVLMQQLFVLAVLANVAYCAAYPVDVFAQISGFRAAWLRYRWVLLAIGLSFAAVITRFFCQGLFGDGV